MAASSAGILMNRGTGRTLEVLLVHPGGHFWRNRDDGMWSIPKGEIEAAVKTNMMGWINSSELRSPIEASQLTKGITFLIRFSPRIDQKICCR
jgi:predicted NUDIX family NTP pyrophosphohydrolase